MPVIGSLTISPYTALYTSLVVDGNITVGTSTAQGRKEIVLDFNNGQGLFFRDFETAFSWPISSGEILFTWQPSLIELPENTYNRATDWDDAGSPGNKLFRGFLLESDTLTNSKSINIERAEDGSFFPPNESPFTANRQSFKAFTFTPPFVSHQVRITSTDGVPWRRWEQRWVTDPWVEYAEFVGPWNNLGFQGAKYLRGLVLPMDTQGVTAEFRIATSAFTGVNFFATTPAAVKTTFSYAFTPPVIASEVQIRCLTATAGAWFEEARWDFDKYPEIIPEYTPIMETGGAGAKYFRGMTLTADTANVSTSFQILYDGGQTGPVITGTFNGKQTLAFAFVPFVFHDIQLVPQANARIWIEESKWHYDEYPELTPEYTPIMEISGPDNKFVQGMKLIADTANLPVTFQILFDGGQTGPSFTGTFNGKQTLVFSWPPFLAHDIQLVPQAAARIWYGGIGQGASEWVFKPFPESTTNWTTELTSMGGIGWQHLRDLNVEYNSTTPITLAFTVDTGNGSIAPATLTIPSSGGTQTKQKILVTFNKWKLLGFSATSSAAFNLFAEGFEGRIRSWGDVGPFRISGPYRITHPAGGPSAGGAEV
jgi:hypothetical protein